MYGVRIREIRDIFNNPTGFKLHTRIESEELVGKICYQKDQVTIGEIIDSLTATELQALTRRIRSAYKVRPKEEKEKSI
jgi:hypothetical protein